MWLLWKESIKVENRTQAQAGKKGELNQAPLISAGLSIQEQQLISHRTRIVFTKIAFSFRKVGANFCKNRIRNVG